MRTSAARRIVCLWVLSQAGCEPTFERVPTLVDRVAILAVQAEPAEAAPGDVVTLRAAVAGPDGPIEDAAVDWAFCTQPRSVAENTPVAQDCLDESAAWIVPIAGGAVGAVTATLPAGGCANFGSEPLPPEPDEDPLRPADPDATGGYYQPVRLTLREPEQLVAFGRVRLLCALPAAPADVVREFRERYAPNRNPTLAELTVVDTSDSGIEVRAGWPETDAEPFVVRDPREPGLVDRTDDLLVSWFSTAGRFASDRTGSGEGTFADNRLSPGSTGEVHVWAVLRDSRGGMDWRALRLEAR